MTFKVSVVVPIFNCENYLYECLDSIVQQSLKDIEIICVNDGSTDKSLDILESFANVDNRIRIINKQNSGYGHTMNVGINAANGKYIGIVESDDYIAKNMFEKLFYYIDSNKLDFLKTDFYRVTGDKENKKITYSQILEPNDNNYLKIITPQEAPGILRELKSISNWTGIYDREFLKKNKILHNETPGASYQDTGFLFQVFFYAKRIMLINEAYYYYRNDNPNSSINNRQKVFCLNEEYDFVWNILNSEEELKTKFIIPYYTRKFDGYMFTYRRVSSEYKIKYLFKMKSEFEQAITRNEINKNTFSSYRWNTLLNIINDPEKFFQQSNKKIGQNFNSQKNADKKTSSIIFRIITICKNIFKKRKC